MLRNKDDRLGQRKAMSPGGKRAPYLTDKPAPDDQDEPSSSLPINAHKRMCGQGLVPRLPSFK